MFKKSLALVALVVSFLVSVPAQSTLLNIQFNGAGDADDILLGVNDLMVGSTTYNVTFTGGTCASVYGSCDTSSLDFLVLGDAQSANVALFNALDNTFFDTRPGQVGTLNPSRTYLTLMIPFEIFVPTFNPSSLRMRYVAMNVRSNGSGEAQYTSSSFDPLVDNNANFRTYVKFEVSSVPEPSTLAIFALGLIGLASRRFKKQS